LNCTGTNIRDDSRYIDALEAYREAAKRLQEDANDHHLAQRISFDCFSEEIRRIEVDITNHISRVRRILIIGGAGYIGSVVVRQLLDRGYHVRVLDNLLYENKESLNNITNSERFEFLEGDFLDQTVLGQALVGVTDIVLLAALVGDPICSKYPEQARQINEFGSINLINTLKHYQINKFIFASTCSNYGIYSGDSAATEEAPLNPLSIYAETKVAVENYLIQLKDNLNYSPTILRFATAYGIGHRTRFDLTINHFTRDLALGKNLTVYDEDTWRPYCHISDISRAIITVLESPKELVEFQIFNVGSNQGNHSKRAIIEIIQQHLPEASVEYGSGGNDPRDYQVDFSKIESVLGFEAQNTADRCISDLITSINNDDFSDVAEKSNFYGNYHISRFES